MMYVCEQVCIYVCACVMTITTNYVKCVLSWDKLICMYVCVCVCIMTVLITINYVKCVLSRYMLICMYVNVCVCMCENTSIPRGASL